MPRADIFLKVVLDYERQDDPKKLADEIRRRIEKLYAVRTVEVASVVTDKD